MSRAATHPLDFQLLNNYQHGFALCHAPFARMAQETASTEELVLAGCARLQDEGRISRIGAVFAPHRVGASLLAAISVAPDRLTEVAALVSRFPEVNHNYEREHHFNLWFVVTSASAQRLARVLADIEAQCGLPVLRLPLQAQYHIDLGFQLEHHAASGPAPAAPPGSQGDTSRADQENFTLDAQGQELVNALQGGLPLVPHPYAAIAQQLGWPEQQVLDHLQSWLQIGVLKRFGVVVRHFELGYTANAMVVHDVPDALVDELGEKLGRYPGVTLCYRRPRVAPDWPYNLFCMLHGRDRAVVQQQIADLRQAFGLQAYAHEVLFSRTRYKQKGAYYVDTCADPAARQAPLGATAA